MNWCVPWSQTGISTRGLFDHKPLLFLLYNDGKWVSFQGQIPAERPLGTLCCEGF